MKGRDLLFSAATEVLTRPWKEEGANAEADAARRLVMTAAVLNIFSILEDTSKNITKAGV